MPSVAERDDPRPLIVHIVYRLQVGGLENGVVNLVNLMPEERYRHAIVCLSETTDFQQRIRRKDVAVYEIHKRPGQDFAAWKRLYDLFRRIRPTVVHTRNIGCLEAQIPAWLARVPCRVHGEHGWDVNDPDGSNRKYRLLRRLHAPLVHRFIALSRELESYLHDSVGIGAAKISRIYNGVDDSRFFPADSNALPEGFRQPDSIVFGTVGRMHGVKDQLNLCQAFIATCREHPNLAARLRLVLIGDGPLREPAMSLLDEAGLASQAWLPGSRNDVPQIMQALDVFVLPSLAEGISNTILEAMACGLPVIATDVGGNGELVIDSTTGALVPAADPLTMAERMAAYATDGAMRRAHGEAALQRISTSFSMQRMLSAYAGVYDELMEQRGLAH
ncbi:MAG: TIGR03088 family PEP-CTERM/XrtA system glycosyltransferase [Gammaproteobacteria bacterium]|nr:TIGR03088 family PEP-CTERM/XrtA system glycosyltransferase [Gammaproteobacteria bacterium]